MVQAIPRSKARLTERQQFWLDHLRVCREQGQTLRGYAKAHGLSVSGLYTAHSTLKSRGVVTEPHIDSLAKKAVAFFRMSRSIRSCRFLLAAA